jgi:hypothetical protein
VIARRGRGRSSRRCRPGADDARRRAFPEPRRLGRSLDSPARVVRSGNRVGPDPALGEPGDLAHGAARGVAALGAPASDTLGAGRRCSDRLDPPAQAPVRRRGGCAGTRRRLGRLRDGELLAIDRQGERAQPAGASHPPLARRRGVFERRGMPADGRAEEGGGDANRPGTARPRPHWESTYAEWLVRHPLEDIRVPLADAPYELSGFADYASVRPGPAATGPGRALGAPGPWGRRADVRGADARALARRAPRSASGKPGRLGGRLLAATTVWYFAGWHLGAVQLPRIFVPVATSLRLSLLVLALAALDRIASARAHRRP